MTATLLPAIGLPHEREVRSPATAADRRIETRDRGLPGGDVRFLDADTDEATGRRVSARVLVYNVVDDYGTVFLPGVFTESLRARMPKIVWSHDWMQPIGRWLDWEEDSRGLILHGELDDPAFVPKAGEVAYQLRVGTLDQFSVGFVRTEERDLSKEFGPGIVGIVRGILDETSPVLVGAVGGTSLLSIRSGGTPGARTDPEPPRFPMLSVRMPGAADPASGAGRLLVPVEDATTVILQMKNGELDLADGLSALKAKAFTEDTTDGDEPGEGDGGDAAGSGDGDGGEQPPAGSDDGQDGHDDGDGDPGDGSDGDADGGQEDAAQDGNDDSGDTPPDDDALLAEVDELLGEL